MIDMTQLEPGDLVWWSSSTGSAPRLFSGIVVSKTSEQMSVLWDDLDETSYSAKYYHETKLYDYLDALELVTKYIMLQSTWSR